MDTKKLRQKILDLAIHGKLVPQDPNDEPASVLLERIKAEKERLIKEGKIKKSRKAKDSADTPHYENVPFEVPSSWEWCKLEDLFFVTKLAGFEYTEYFTKEAISSKNAIPIVRAKNIRMGKFIENEDEAIPENVSTKLERSALTKDCLLMTFIGAGIGDVCLFKAYKRCHLAPNVAKLESYTNFINLEYVLFFIMSDFGQLGINGISKSTAQASLSMATIRSLSLAIPSFEEQTRIVAEVKKIFEFIDIIECNQKCIKTTINQTKSKILDLAIHGKLVPQDSNDEPASELLKRINPKSEISCDNGHSRKLPVHWCQCKIKDVFKIVMGQSPKGDSINNYEGIEFHQGKLNFTEKWVSNSPFLTNDPLKIAKPYSLLLCVRAPVGVVNMTKREVCIGRGLCALENSEALDKDYAFYAVKTYKDIFESKATGSTFKAISKNIIENELFFLPPISEQKRIVNKIESLFEIINQIKNSLEA